MRHSDLDTPLRIATCPVVWNNNDLPGFRPVIPFPELLDEMVAAGYDCTEYDASFGDDPEILKQELALRGLTFAGSYQWADFENDEAFQTFLSSFEPRLRLLAAIECRHLIVADRLRDERVAIAGQVPEDGSAGLDEQGFARIGRNLARLRELTDQSGIKVHYHNHVGTYVEAPWEVGKLVEVLPETGVDLCFDTGHYAFGGGDSASFLANHINQIGYLHLKDVDSKVLTRAKANQWSFLEALRHYIFSPLGQGNANIPAIAQQLSALDRDLIVVVEQDTCKGDRTETARQNLQTLQALLTQSSDSTVGAH